MLRKIIRIDGEKCNGCGACAAACHEGAIEMINGKAKLTREDRLAPQMPSPLKKGKHLHMMRMLSDRQR